MFRPMRRGRQELNPEEVSAILEKGSSGVLALAGDNNYPYALPISYVYSGGKLYFHCARQGQKIDAIKRNPRASFCVVAQDRVMPEEYTTYFRSVIAFGQIRLLEDKEEIFAAIDRLGAKYAPHHSAEKRRGFIEKELAALCMLEMSIDHVTGKEAKELMMQRRSAE